MQIQWKLQWASITIDVLMGNVENPGTILQHFNFDDVGYSPADRLSTELAHLLPEEQLKKRLGLDGTRGQLAWDICHYPDVLEAIKTGNHINRAYGLNVRETNWPCWQMHHQLD